MRSHADGSVTIQTSAQSVLVPPAWFGEVALLTQYLRTQGILAAINAQVRFARRRFGRFESIDFLAVLFGYAESRRAHTRSLLRAAATLGQRLHGALCA